MKISRIFATLCCMEAALGARILGLFPTPSISHQVVFHAITLELARRGHELVMLTTDPFHQHPNITEIDVHDVAYPILTEVVIQKIFEGKRNGGLSILKEYVLFMEFQERIFEILMALPELQELINKKEEKFDLIIVESMSRPMHAFRHRFKAPVISVSSFAGFGFNYDSVGVPTHPLLYPDVLAQKPPRTNVIQKAVTIYEYLFKYIHSTQAQYRLNKMTRKVFGEDTPDVAELEALTDMLFLNVHPIWDGIKPTPPNVFYMWGGHLKPTKELSSDLKSYLDNSTRGVVYMSLGTNMKSTELSADRLRVFLETFRRLPYEVLWKWEADVLPGKPDNVRIEKWLPQADMLKHPNVKAFISQGGLQSTDEALQAGVPMVGIPIFADQGANTERFETHGVGIALDLNTLTSGQLEDAIKQVAQNEKYRAAVQRMTRLLLDGEGAGGVGKAAWWAEYVIRHGGAQHLRSPAAGVSAVEYFMLDVVAAFLLVAAFGFVLVVIVAKFIYVKLMLIFARLSFKLKRH